MAGFGVTDAEIKWTLPTAETKPVKIKKKKK